MKSATKNIVLAVALIFFVGMLEAQENGIGPHGGRLKTASNYKIEVFGCNDYLEIYLFDGALNAINNNNLSGTVEFFYTAKATLSSPLVHYGMDGFTAKIPANTFLYCKPSFNMNGMFIVTEKFENECLMSAG
ncbi:MAG TPA: hypothetical protein VF411_09085, partial [Bacteroidia bacterium]